MLIDRLMAESKYQMVTVDVRATNSSAIAASLSKSVFRRDEHANDSTRSLER